MNRSNPIYSQTAQRDYSLVQQVCSGKIDAFAQLISLYEKKIRTLGFGFFRNNADTDDFVQDVFIKLYTKISTFRGEAQFSTWLMRIAYNMAINAVNRRTEYTSLSENIEILDTDYGPEEKQLRSLAAEVIRDAIKELPKQFEICLDLYFFYDFPHNEISVITGWPINTIKSHIFRAKKQLKQKLENFILPDFL